MAKRYWERLKDVEGLILPIEKEHCFSVYWMYTIRIDPSLIKIKRDDLILRLKEKGIDLDDMSSIVQSGVAAIGDSIPNLQLSADAFAPALR